MTMPQDILDFWFVQTTPRQWWEKSAAFDALIRERFGDIHVAASRAELQDWRQTPEGRLAEIIVLDQFSRNIHRDSAKAFAADGMALVLAQEAVGHGADQALPAERRAFLYMPYMHSESSLIHATAVRLFGVPGLENSYKFELMHKAIIDRFGRYPHRNTVLGRPSTPQEEEFLRMPGSSF